MLHGERCASAVSVSRPFPDYTPVFCCQTGGVKLTARYPDTLQVVPSCDLQRWVR
jgi:hypothetical protein